ncbi:hypothetical protein JQW92_16995 [Sulfitobacter pseudonitzschiae]|uniref:hypothetical protein n=1 Tax=Pseudosulfitobacter pseudonitzschiae TaxID=1402135 RepID=UPI001AF601BC|nr:hypothetical protein [Pseudosulfitobacter pseudonitzschiae]MBM1833767.1 hypothetical protein [Pseudosulfitobacter pseudonitzschiae]MBM1838633.1 hypothetical protein [Pseudosulfitobacter pseudonitzschiae]MBM1842981.1 hypothetical protein [Pseudosulfitobacter pseudonitzschiae]MBM1847847.1 hypothetical protein [Pseudosulfitobacter pseudonitzschiae]MBM1853189.1 hypothetical protein [Pseudosulfitobacter pseudonitzschiae]
MPLTFPLSYAEFLAVLPISSITMECPEVVEISQTAGAEVLLDEIGNRYWQGVINLGRMQRHEKREAQVLIDAVRSASGSFFASDISQSFPQDDPTGSGISGATPKISSLPADKRLIGLSGLPSGYTLRRGDYLSFTYLSNPTRYALHRIVDATVTANGSGATADFEVMPHIQPGAATNTSVELVRPSCKAIILPDSVQPGRTNRFIHEGMSFGFMQTLR